MPVGKWFRAAHPVKSILVYSLVVLIIFFAAHWWGSVFMQTFFLHRYGTHRMFTMSMFWERTFHLLTFLFQGSSYLIPRGYAWMHREHHAYSDTEKDPHSPHQFKDAAAMMWKTKERYDALTRGTTVTEDRFNGPVPSWPALDAIGNSYITRIAFGVGYTLFYLAFAPHWAFFLLLSGR